MPDRTDRLEKWVATFPAASVFCTAVAAAFVIVYPSVFSAACLALSAIVAALNVLIARKER